MAARPFARCFIEPLEQRCMYAAFVVNQAPRLQPGNAPLAGFPGSELDRVDLLWQTIPGSEGPQDSFGVDYRPAGAGTWAAATFAAPIDTGIGGRVVHSATLTGLAWNADYEYRVRHVRDGAVFATYEHGFHTRLRAGDPTPFSFAAYGDSATPTPTGFRAVQARINQVAPAFAVLLGDNIYDTGTHDQADARFSAERNPEAAAWIAGHIDYLGLGNHDIATAAGLPSEQGYSVPIPVAGITAPAAPPAAERPEHSFSFDYGSVHFVTFDTNSYQSPDRLRGLLDWAVADLASSTARWKIVYGHHPLAGVPDKPESPAGDYYQQVVSRFRAAGVDLFMTGHSHTYAWTYPLTGQVGGVATFVDHGGSGRFVAGEGLPQLVSGVGGAGLRAGDFGQFPFVAAGYSASTATPARLGFSKIDVTPTQLVVSYVAADDGSTIGSFTIAKEDVRSVSFQPGVDGYAGVIDTFLHQNMPSTPFGTAPSLKVDADNPTGTWLAAQAVLRFQDLFGAQANRIPVNAVLRSATLQVRVTNGGDAIDLHRMAAAWSPLDTWLSRVGGVQADGREAVAFADVSTGRVEAGTLSIDVLASLRAWQKNPLANQGWAFLPTGPDGVDFDSAEGAAPPKLVVTFVPTDAVAVEPARFLVADGTTQAVVGYTAGGAVLETAALAPAAGAARGIAASPDGSRRWILGRDGTVTVYDGCANLLGTWRADGLRSPTGIAVAGRDVFVTDSSLRRVVIFADAVGRLTGSQAASRWFRLAASNTNAQDLATDGVTVWVAQAGSVGMVFVYRASDGRSLGAWRLDPRNRVPTGITIDPSGADRSIWIVDAATRTVFRYAAAQSLRQGSRTATSLFALAAANVNPQGLADPPLAGRRAIMAAGLGR